ncbi:hypothetical protein [Echinicola sp. 20G]|uniref:hypothetical protein n=1 Tax=Echinicola sp. 20G TaxID=2781961 RepID=UPI00190FE4B9|nr:hypothetical protein [Echinicola sp. 20G]
MKYIKALTIIAFILFVPFPLVSFGQGTISKNYDFDSDGISREVLENYLERAITMAFFLVPNHPEGSRTYPYHNDDIRMVKELHAKFIGRAIYRWGEEDLLNEDEFYTSAKKIINNIHRGDPSVVFQACLFEIITTDVEKIKVPKWVFQGMGLPIKQRNFSYWDMLNEHGGFVDHWGKGKSVPDISRLETRMWFYYLSGTYMRLGCEAIHLGQVELMAMNDPGFVYWQTMLKAIRDLAKKESRRGWVIIDAHVPKGGMLKDGISLIDFNSFPLRVKEVVQRPLGGILEVGHLDAIYQRSDGGMTPSGWTCDHLPYLVEFDNFGKSRNSGMADTTSHFVWGWDEISWFSLLDGTQRDEWIHYAYNWLKENDQNGHLQMPGNRMITCPNRSEGSYRANTKSQGCPIGYSQEKTISTIWDPKGH